MRGLKNLWAPLIAVFILSLSAPANAQFMAGLTIDVAPPALPAYTTIPLAPAPNYMWQPGYWAWGPAGYYWVPGTWVAAPQQGYLWTPGYWGWNGNGYAYNNGYWANQVGFYGGINYGFGYPGTGFYGGRWGPGGFAYNTAVWPVNRTVIHNTYIDKTVIHKTVINRTSYNGGKNGIHMRPNAEQMKVAQMHHITLTQEQLEHRQQAAQDRNTYTAANKGTPKTVTQQHAYSHNNPVPHPEKITQPDRDAAKPHETKSNGNGAKPPAQQHPDNSHKPPAR